MEEKDMTGGLMKHPEKDNNHDGIVTLLEKLLYYLKMIPYAVLSIFVPTIKQAVDTGIASFMPDAISIVTKLATDQITAALTGEEKANAFNDEIKALAIEKGVTLGTQAVNYLRENAYAFYLQEKAREAAQ